MNTLPTLGLGLSTNAQRDDSPHPYALLDAHPGLFDYVEYSAPLDVAQARAEATLFAEMERRRADVPLVYHPVHLNLFGPDLESPERLALAAEHVRAVGSPWVSNDVGWWHQHGVALPGYLYLSPPLSAEGLEVAVRHVAHVRDAMPVPLLVENPVVMTRRGTMHVLEFMSRLHEATGCPLLIDVGHLVSHQLTYGLPLEAGFEGVPWGAVAQLHVAGGVVTAGGVYADDHPQPIRDETWAVLGELHKRCTALKAITYEGDGHPDALALRTLRKLPRPAKRGEGGGEGRTRSPGDVAHVSPSPGGLRPSDLSPLPQGEVCWSHFAEVHRTEGPERDYRVAVLAQQLDVEVPFARAAVAPTLIRVGEFISSPVFEAWFREGTKPLADAFLQWAMVESRRPELAGADALVSFQVWARSTWARARKTGVTSTQAAFPVDLTEAVHAVQALRRHLRARGGLNDVHAWEGVLQCARRAPREAWRVVLPL